jgi:hypothetical protein
MPRAILIAVFTLLCSTGATATPPWPRGVNLLPGTEISEDYRHQFDLCDTDGRFRGHSAHGCRDDPNQTTALRRLPSGAIAYSAKLAVDLDGSPFACGPDHTHSDQCPTSLMLPGPRDSEIPVDADRIPYVVIPEAGPADVHGEFGRLTGVQVGDFGVVFAKGRIVPVIVADTGPYSKLGEGSLALHRALGRELCTVRDRQGICRHMIEPMESVSGEVVTILFPGSARNDLTPVNIAGIVAREGLRLWKQARALDESAPRSQR